MSVRDLSLGSLKKAYGTGLLDPRTLIAELRDRALETADYNAWITLLDEEQLEPYLSRLDGCGPGELPLYGVPFAIKDNIDLAGVPTTAACPAFAYTPGASAVAVQLLIDAGAIPLGKTNLDQFATGLVGTRSPYGEGRNTFNPDYISGGSSAGSAIATALGLVSFALGTDTAGSGRVPAVLNNLIGHKPTRGVISNRGMVPACRTLDCISLFTTVAEDVATILDVVARYDEADAYARPNRWSNRGRYLKASVPEGFRFGVPRALDFCGDAETSALFDQAVAQLQALGGEAMEIDFEPFLEAARLLYQGPWVTERWLAAQSVAASDLRPEIATILSAGKEGSAAELFTAQYRLAELKRVCDGLLSGLDVVVTPTTPTFYTREELAADPIGRNSVLGTYTNFMNLLDYAATAVPVGFTRSGVPWGVTLFGRAFADIELLGYVAALQRQCSLPLGATGLPLPPVSAGATVPAPPDEIAVVVCGAHLQGQPLNWQLTDRGGRLLESIPSSPAYRLYALPDGRRPGMVRVAENGCSIEVEVWSLPADTFGSFVAGIPAPLGIGQVELADGRWLSGFICDGYGLEGATDISEFGGWRSWLAHRAKQG